MCYICTSCIVSSGFLVDLFVQIAVEKHVEHTPPPVAIIAADAFAQPSSLDKESKDDRLGNEGAAALSSQSVISCRLCLYLAGDAAFATLMFLPTFMMMRQHAACRYRHTCSS
jgi:hypothetical protein